MNEQVINKLKTIAEKSVASDEDGFSVFDYSGGNFDDAYSLGCDAGEVFLAREILGLLNIGYSIKK